MLLISLKVPIRLALLLLAAQIPAFSAEVAVLNNGFTIRFDRKVQTGQVTRLFTREGFVEISTSEIARFEHDDSEDVSAAPTTQPAVLPPGQPVTAAHGQVGTPAALSSPRTLSRSELDQIVREASDKNRLDPDFVSSLIKVESNFQSRAVSRKGAQGLMQLMPTTASKLGVSDAFDPKANVEAGTAHLSSLLDQYNNDAVKALAAYNAGAHRVDQYHGVPPYRETRAYVASIVRDYNAKKRAQMKAQPPATRAKAASKKTAPAQPTQAGTTKPQKPA